MTTFFWHSSYLAHVPLGTVLKRDTQCNDQWKNPAWFLQSQFADHFDRPARQTPCEVFASSSTQSLLPLNTSRRGGTGKGASGPRVPPAAHTNLVTRRSEDDDLPDLVTRCTTLSAHSTPVQR